MSMKKSKNRYIPPHEYEQILYYLEPENRALCEILRLTGFRLNDILSTRNYQWNKANLEIKEQKTKNLRRVKLTPEIKHHLELYRRARKIQKTKPLAYTFRNHDRGRPSDRHKTHRTSIYRDFAEAVRKAGYAGRGYTVHSIRHIYAHERYAETGDYWEIMQDLGHKYVATTLIYCFT